jgi:hypothetical protein
VPHEMDAEGRPKGCKEEDLPTMSAHGHRDRHGPGPNTSAEEAELLTRRLYVVNMQAMPTKREQEVKEGVESNQVEPACVWQGAQQRQLKLQAESLFGHPLDRAEGEEPPPGDFHRLSPEDLNAEIDKMMEILEAQGAASQHNEKDLDVDDVHRLLALISEQQRRPAGAASLGKYDRPSWLCESSTTPLPRCVFADVGNGKRRYEARKVSTSPDLTTPFDNWLNSGGKRAIIKLATKTDGVLLERRAGRVKRYFAAAAEGEPDADDRLRYCQYSIQAFGDTRGFPPKPKRGTSAIVAVYHIYNRRVGQLRGRSNKNAAGDKPRIEIRGPAKKEKGTSSAVHKPMNALPRRPWTVSGEPPRQRWPCKCPQRPQPSMRKCTCDRQGDQGKADDGAIATAPVADSVAVVAGGGGRDEIYEEIAKVAEEEREEERAGQAAAPAAAGGGRAGPEGGESFVGRVVKRPGPGGRVQGLGRCVEL